MQILLAAPFLVLAAILFTLLSAFGNLRRFAITIPAGVLAFGLGGAEGVRLAGHFGEPSAGPAAHSQANLTAAVARAAAGFGLGGLMGAIAVSLALMWALRVAPEWGLRTIAFCGALCSYFVLTTAAMVPINYALRAPDPPSWVFTGFEFIMATALSLLGAWMISGKPEGYRIARRAKRVADSARS